MTLKSILSLVFTTILALSLVGCSGSNHKSGSKVSVKDSRVMAMSMSTDGNYVLTTNSNQRAYIWNLKDKTYRKVTVKPVNIYSAFFIPDSRNIMVQNDQTNEVYIEDIHGNVIKTFNPGFATYMEIVTPDLKNYFAADQYLNIYQVNTETNKKTQRFLSWCNAHTKQSPYYEANPYKGPLPNGCLSSMGGLPNFKLVKDDSEVVATMGYKLYFWDVGSNKWYDADAASEGPMSFTISPNKKYVITGDQQFVGSEYILNNSSSKRFYYKVSEDNNASQLNHVNFIDTNKVLATYTQFPHAFMKVGLYKIDQLQTYTKTKKGWINYYVKPIKDLSLVKNSQSINEGQFYPQTQSFLPVVATSSKAHLLVMAQANGNGIMVYKYDPENQTLKLIWAPAIK